MSTLNGTDLFGLNTIQKDTLNKILDYLNTLSAQGVTVFPSIPQDMFFGFDLFETRSIMDALTYEWTTNINPPEYVYEYGFSTIGAKAIANAVTTKVVPLVPFGFVLLSDSDGTILADADAMPLMEAA